MPWPGLRDDTGATGSGAAENVNTSHENVDELRRRHVLRDRQAFGGPAVSDINDPVNGQYVVIRDESGNLKAGAVGASPVTLASGLDTGVIGTFAKSNGRLYYANGFDPVKVIDSVAASSARSAGIESGLFDADPTASSSGGVVTAGDHLVRIRWGNSTTGYFGDPSAAVTVTVTAGQKVTLIWGATLTDPSDSNVDEVIVEMTVASGTAYYVAHREPVASSGTFYADISDADLIQQEILDADSDGFGSAQPPLMDTLASHRGRLFGMLLGKRTKTGVTATNASATVTGTGFSTQWSGLIAEIDGVRYRIESADSATQLTLDRAYAGTTGSSKTMVVYARNRDLLYWSLAGLPESWRPLRKARRVFQNKSDTPTGMATFYDLLVIVGQSSMSTLLFTADPATGKLDHIPTHMGAYNQRCLINAEGRLYGLGQAGAWQFNGTTPRHISDPADDTYRSLVDESQSAEFHGAYDPIERTIAWFFTRTGDTEPRDAIVYHLDTGNWSTRTYRQAIIGSSTVSAADGKVYACLSDTNGYTWYSKAGIYDGDDGGTAVLTTTTGSTTTVIQSATDLTGRDLAGMTLRNDGTGEDRLVTSNTASAITVSSAFSSAPATGVTLWLGSVQTSYRPKWPQPGPDRMRFDHMRISYVPDAGELYAQLYADFNDTAIDATAGTSWSQNADVTIADGSDQRLVDLAGSVGKGYVNIPVPGDRVRTARWRIVCAKPQGTLRLLHASLDPAETGRAGNQ